MRAPLIPIVVASSLAVVGSSSHQLPSGPAAQAPDSSPPRVQSFSIRIEAPAQVGLPIWVRADLEGRLTARYPFDADPRWFGPNRLELTRDGQALTPLLPGIVQGGFQIGASPAPQSSPQNRLPLHLGFLIDRPGRYSVRWSVVDYDRQPETVAQSNWFDFTVGVTRPADREAWLRSLLAAPPTDAGAYVGDYLPSLLAAVPDRRVANVVIAGTFSAVSLIASCSRDGLQVFPAEVSVPVTMETLFKRGPNSNLAYFVSWHAAWFQDRRDEIVGTAVSFLRSPDDAVAAGALQMLSYARRFDWRKEDTAMHEADRAVEAAAAALTAREGAVGRALAVYLPGIKSPASRDRLWQQIEQQPAARGQALIALTWIADPRDLPRLGDLLIQPRDREPRATDLSSVPYHLSRAYREAAEPYLRRALAESEHVWVRVASAKELAVKGRAEGFRFFLDAITENRFYRQELVGWIRETFRLPAGVADAELIAFLNERIRSPQPRPVSTSPAGDAIARLQSADSSDRKAAAKALLELAPQSPLAMNLVTAPLIQEVIREPDRVNPDTWFDAAVILGRLRRLAGLELYLERDGATAALIETGEPAVHGVRAILNVGSPTRRRLAAEVLGAIGGLAARDALTAALKSESDAGVRRAIQTALSRLGQRPPRAEIR